MKTLAENIYEIPSRKMSPALRHYHRRAELNVKLGLTCKGTKRLRRPNAGNRKRELAMRRERVLENWQKRVVKFRRSGLTTRGTPRIYPVRRGDALLLRSDIEQLARAIAATFNDLSPAAQVRVLELENHLANIQKQLL